MYQVQNHNNHSDYSRHILRNDILHLDLIQYISVKCNDFIIILKKNVTNYIHSRLPNIKLTKFYTNQTTKMREGAFITLTNGFKDKLFRLAKRLLVSNEEAEDATQEVLLKLWKNKSKMAEYKNVEAFAMTMTKNYCYDKLKAKETGNLKIVHSNYKDEQPSLQRQVEARDSLDWVGKIMDNLPEQQRMIIQLRDIEQYNNPEIAEMLGINETAVRVALSRGRKKIREALLKKHNYGVV